MLELTEQEILNAHHPEPGSLIELAYEIGVDNMGKLLDLLGGDVVYIPTRGDFYTKLGRKIRDEHVRSAFRGCIKETAEDFGLSHRTVRRIVTRGEE